MKINIIGIVIALLITALATYIFCVTASDGSGIFPLIIGAIGVLATTVMLFGISSTYQRTSTLLKVVSLVFFLIVGVLNLMIALFSWGNSMVIISNGIVLLTYLILMYYLWRTKQ